MTLNRQNVIDAYKIWLDREASDDEINTKFNHAVASNWGWAELSQDMREGSDEFKKKAEAKIEWWFTEASYGPKRTDGPTAAELDHYTQRIAQVGWQRLDTIEGNPPGSGDIGNIWYTDRGYANKAAYDAAQSSTTTNTTNTTNTTTTNTANTANTNNTTTTNTANTNNTTTTNTTTSSQSQVDSKFIIPGKGGAKFGDADYRELLNRTDGSYNALKEVRNDVLEWIRNHPDRDSILDTPNKPNYDEGSNDGLYERINTATPDFDRDDGGRFFTKWGDPAIDINKDKVSYSDILAWKAGGHSPFQIYSYMNRNKDQWKDSTGATEVYNTIRSELITRGNDWGNMYGKEDGKYSWRNTLENPLFQELGKYIKSSGVKDNKSTAWWMYDKDAYRETLDWLNERHDDYDWLTADKSGKVTTGPRTQEELESIIGSTGVAGTGGVGVGGDYTEGEYWEQWGTLGPRKDTKLALAETQKVAAGIGLGRLDITDSDIEDKLDALEERFLKAMYEGTTTDEAKYKEAKDSWGLDLIRKDMNPEDWDEDWFTNDTMSNTWFETLAYGDKDDIDWAYYDTNRYYKDAREALGMDDKIDTIKEIREANMYVYAAVLADENSDHLEDWIAYEPKFDNTTPVEDPLEISVGSYKTPEKDKLTPAPDRPSAPTINIPKVKLSAPANMKTSKGSSDLKTVGGTY